MLSSRSGDLIIPKRWSANADFVSTVYKLWAECPVIVVAEGTGYLKMEWAILFELTSRRIPHPLAKATGRDGGP